MKRSRDEEFPPHVVKLLNELRENLLVQALFYAKGTNEWNEELKQKILFEKGKEIQKAMDALRETRKETVQKRMIEEGIEAAKKEVNIERAKRTAEQYKILERLRSGKLERILRIFEENSQKSHQKNKNRNHFIIGFPCIAPSEILPSSNVHVPFP